MFQWCYHYHGNDWPVAQDKYNLWAAKSLANNALFIDLMCSMRYGLCWLHYVEKNAMI